MNLTVMWGCGQPCTPLRCHSGWRFLMFATLPKIWYWSLLCVNVIPTISKLSHLENCSSSLTLSITSCMFCRTIFSLHILSYPSFLISFSKTKHFRVTSDVLSVDSTFSSVMLTLFTTSLTCEISLPSIIVTDSFSPRLAEGEGFALQILRTFKRFIVPRQGCMWGERKLYIHNTLTSLEFVRAPEHFNRPLYKWFQTNVWRKIKNTK